MVRLVEAMQARPDLGVVALVVSNLPGVAGLGKARALGVPTHVEDHRAYAGDRARFETVLTGVLSEARIDVLCLAGFMRILTAPFVSRYAARMLNIHPSLLPKFRGLDTHSRALAAGETEHGCTVHLVTPELDDGPVLGQGTVPVLADDTPETLAKRVQAMEHRLYPAVLYRYLEGTKAPLHLS